jgi:tetratricopeptide (TPR) repeat protein
MEIINQAYLFSSLGQGVFEHEGQFWQFSLDNDELIPLRMGDVNLLIDAALESTIVENKSLTELYELLADLENQFFALDFFLSGLDDSLQPDTRRELLEQANELCQNQQIEEFVRTRFFNHPMPKVADLLTALQLSQPYDLVAKIYQDWLVAKLKEAWDKVLPQQISVKEKREAINQQITDKNLFPQLATAFGDWPQFHQLLQQIELSTQPEKAKAIFKLFQQRLAQATHIEIPAYAPPPEARLLTELKNLAQTHQKTYQPAKRWNLQQVINDQEKIKKDLRHARLKQAQQIAENLIEYYISHLKSIEQVRKNITKSLSILVREAMKYHHFTLAHQWLDYAEIVDDKNAVIKNNRAELLKAEGKFPQALAVYQQTMKDFPKDAVARTGYAELLKLQGDYSAALAVYQQTMKDFPKDAVARTGYAELLKLQEALAVYGIFYAMPNC